MSRYNAVPGTVPVLYQYCAVQCSAVCTVLGVQYTSTSVYFAYEMYITTRVPVGIDSAQQHFSSFNSPFLVWREVWRPLRH